MNDIDPDDDDDDSVPLGVKIRWGSIEESGRITFSGLSVVWMVILLQPALRTSPIPGTTLVVLLICAFVCNALHAFAHFYSAASCGLKTTKIAFRFTSHPVSIPDYTHWQVPQEMQSRMLQAGPLLTFTLACLSLGLIFVSQEPNGRLVFLGLLTGTPLHSNPRWSLVLGSFCYVALVRCCFDFLPLHWSDGGRILELSHRYHGPGVTSLALVAGKAIFALWVIVVATNRLFLRDSFSWIISATILLFSLLLLYYGAVSYKDDREWIKNVLF